MSLENKIPLPAVLRVPTGRKDQVAFELPEYSRASVWRLLKKAHKKHGGYVKLTIELIRRSRTTGKHSQNAHFNGHCQQIAMETGNSFGAVKMHMKRLACSRGYPTETVDIEGVPIDEEPIPISEADATVEDCKHLIDAVHQFADEWGIRLVEEDYESKVA